MHSQFPGRKRADSLDEAEPREYAISLIRVSSDRQADEDRAGIPAQQAACDVIAKRHNLTVKWPIRIEGVSGAAVMLSPGMKELKRIVSAGLTRAIVLKEESRLMRPENFADYALLSLLEEHHVKLYYPDKVMDLRTPDGKMFSTFSMAMAGRERTAIRDRMIGGKYAKRDRGEWIVGTAPLGFKVVKDERKMRRLVVDPATIGKVQRLFKMFVEGNWNFQELARETGIKVTTIRYALKNELYTGVHVVKRVADPRGHVHDENGRIRYTKRLAIPVEEQKRIQLIDKPPISRELFDRVQDLLRVKQSQRSTAKGSVSDPFVYRGFLKCAECGGTITTLRYFNRKANFEASYYACRRTIGHFAANNDGTNTIVTPPSSCPSRRMRLDALHPLLDQMIAFKLGSREFLERIIEAQGSAEVIDQAQQEANLRAEIEAAEAAKTRNEEMYMRGRISIDKFDANADRLSDEIKNAKKALRSLRPAPPVMDASTWAPLALQFRRWDKMAPTQKRTLLSILAPKFEVSAIGGHRFNADIVIKKMRLMLGGEDEITLNLTAA